MKLSEAMKAGVCSGEAAHGKGHYIASPEKPWWEYLQPPEARGTRNSSTEDDKFARPITACALGMALIGIGERDPDNSDAKNDDILRKNFPSVMRNIKIATAIITMNDDLNFMVGEIVEWIEKLEKRGII